MDVTLKAEGDGGNLETAVIANDWLSISDEALLKRIAPVEGNWRRKGKEHCFETTEYPSLQLLRTAEGRYVGRAAICATERYFMDDRGIVTVGGMRACRLQGMLGVLIGSSRRAARDSAVPIIPIPILKNWAESEGGARLREGHPPEALASIAKVVISLGAERLDLPVARTDSGWVTLEQIQEIANSMDEVFLVQDASVDLAGGKVATVQLNKSVFAIEVGMMITLQSESYGMIEWPPLEQDEHQGTDRYFSRSIQGAVIRALARGWGCSVKDLVSGSSFGSDRETFDLEIGTLADKPYVDHVAIIRRPKAKV